MNVDWLNRFKYLILAAFLSCIAAGSLFSSNLSLDPSLESRFIRDNPHLRAYKEFNQSFGSEPLLLVVWNAEGSVWDPQNLSRLRELAEKIQKVDGVDSVISIANLSGINDIDAKGTDIATLKILPLVRKLLVDGDARRSVLLIIPKQWAASPSAGLLLVKNVENLIGKNAFVTGPLAMQSKAIEFSRIDLVRTLLIVAICVILLFVIAYRSWQAIAIALIVTAFAISGACGILAAFRVKLSQFALIALPILAVAGLEDVVFLLRHYGAARGQGAGRVEACRQMFLTSGVPCFWTTATTIAGFASLLIGDIEQIRSVGLVLVTGSPLALIASMLVTPTFLMARPMKARAHTESGMTSSFVSFIHRHAGMLAAGFIVATIVASYGLRYASVRFDFPNIFRPDIEFQKQFHDVDEKFAGGASFEIVMQANDGGNFSEMEKINLIGGLQLALSLTGPVTTTVSPIDVGLTAYIIKNGVPNNPGELLKKADHLVAEMGKADLSPLSGWLSKDLKKARIHVRVRTDREKHYDELLSTLAYLRDGFKRKGVDMTWSGFSLLYKEMEKRMVKALIYSFVVAFVSVLVMLMILLRSVKWGAVAMIPNILPIVMIVGIMGWFRVGFSLGLIILPAIGIGLIVDDTIHFIWGVRRLLRMGFDIKEAVTKVLRTSGTAMVLATVILVAGFASLAVSPFISNVELAIFMPLLLLLALLFDIVGVPIMLFLLVPSPRHHPS